MAEYSNENTWAVWKQDDTDGGKPVVKGHVEIGEDLAELIKAGERKFYLSGWKRPGGNAPILGGEIQAPYKGEQTQQPVAAGANDNFDF